MANKALALAALMVVRQMDKSLREDIPDDIVNNIYGFAGGAVAASLVPVPGLDVALATADIWMMYVRINSLLGISFSENMMKSIGSAVIANLTANIGQMAVGSALKFIPGIGSAIGGALMGMAVFDTTVASGWIYLKALCNFYENGGDGDLEATVKDVLKNDKDEIRNIVKEEKKNYQNK